jgi:hypothetical protein
VDSIVVNNKQVGTAKAGDPAGFLWGGEKPKVREGLRVFMVSESSANSENHHSAKS